MTLPCAILVFCLALWHWPGSAATLAASDIPVYKPFFAFSFFYPSRRARYERARYEQKSFGVSCIRVNFHFRNHGCRITAERESAASGQGGSSIFAWSRTRRLADDKRRTADLSL